MEWKQKRSLKRKRKERDAPRATCRQLLALPLGVFIDTRHYCLWGRGDVRKARNVTPTPSHWCSAICLESAVASDTWTRAAGQSAGTCSRPPAVRGRDNHDTGRIAYWSSHRCHCHWSTPLQEHVLSQICCRTHVSSLSSRLQFSIVLAGFLSCSSSPVPFCRPLSTTTLQFFDQFCYYGLSALFIFIELLPKEIVYHEHFVNL